MNVKPKRQPKFNNIAVPEGARQLAAEVMAEGQHGTLGNTVMVALKTHLRFIRGELIAPQKAA